MLTASVSTSAPVQDRQTQLAPKTIKNWNENPGETLLPRATTTKRLRRQRETAQAHWRSAIGFPAASGPFMPSMMTCACRWRRVGGAGACSCVQL